MIVVYSPHCDDAIFSIGAHLATEQDVLIVSPMAGMPPDDVGRAKYERIHTEHVDACKLIGATYRNGPFLDDVYPPAPSVTDLVAWLVEYFFPTADAIYIPLGIHHPDHVLVSDVLLQMVRELDFYGRVFLYEELPYRVDYPELVTRRTIDIAAHGPLYGWQTESTVAKRTAVLAYRSQTNFYGTDVLDEEQLSKLLVPERIWELKR